MQAVSGKIQRQYCLAPVEAQVDTQIGVQLVDAGALSRCGAEPVDNRVLDLQHARVDPQEHQRPAVRVEVNPNALASAGLGMDDIRAAISAANVNMPKGSFDGPTRAIMLDANDQMRSAQEYRDLVIAWRGGAPLRLGDLAEVDQGPENRQLAAWSGETPAILINIQRQSGANVIEVVDAVHALLPRLQAAMPTAVDVNVLSDRTESIRASIKGVQHELLLAIGLVVLVTFVFLRTIPATIIPSLAVPLSLVATFGFMLMAGYSLNNLTLMALTIATGFVVDDAIVMLENVARHLEEGKPRLQAALDGARQIGFTLISLTVSLIAVLIPLLFMGDVVGRLFHEFAMTLAVAIAVSLVVSLTLTPMMCARFLKAGRDHGIATGAEGKAAGAEGDMFDRVIALYDRATGMLLTGDTIYPGRLYISSFSQYLASIQRLADFVETNPLTWIMGTHIEMSNTPGVDFPLGAASHPDEHPLQLAPAILDELLDALIEMQANPHIETHDEFIIFPF